MKLEKKKKRENKIVLKNPFLQNNLNVYKDQHVN